MLTTKMHKANKLRAQMRPIDVPVLSLVFYSTEFSYIARIVCIKFKGRVILMIEI